MFLYDKEKLSLFKSFGALNKASYQDGVTENKFFR